MIVLNHYQFYYLFCLFDLNKRGTRRSVTGIQEQKDFDTKTVEGWSEIPVP